MLPTLRAVLDMPVLQVGQPEVLRTGDLDAQVRWVHVSETAEVATLLQGGELVLTTGMAFNDPAQWDRFLPALAEAGAVGVAIELGSQIDAIPAAVLATLPDACSLTVTALHRRVRFVEVTEHVHRRIVNEQYAEVDYARRVHEMFTTLNMRRATLPEILESAAEILDAALVLEDLNHQVLAYAGHQVPTGELLADWERRSRLMADQGWLSRPVGPFRQEWGRLVAPMVATDSARAVMTVERAAQALALRRMVDQDRSSLELRAHSGLIDDLRTGRVRDEAEATARAAALGLRPSLTYLPLTVRVAEQVSADQVVVAARRTRTTDAIVQAIRAGGHTALAAARDDGQVDLLLAPRSVPGATPDAVLTEVCTAVRRDITRVDGISGVVIGVGGESARLVDAASGLDESAHVAEVAAAMQTGGGPTRPCYRAADVRLRGLLALIRSDPSVQAFAETELRGLLADRARNGDAMFDLLRAYLEVGGNKTALAQRTHLSRPTLYARLATLRRILGVDLDDPESQSSLYVAMLILQRC